MRAFLESPYWEYITVASVGIGLFACLLFVIRFQMKVGFTWWRHLNGQPNHFGRFLMIRKMLLASLFILIITNRVFPDWLGKEPVTALLMVAFALQTFVPYRLLILAHETQEASSDKLSEHR